VLQNSPSLWRDHIRFFVDYTVALAKNDKAGQQEAVDNLTGYSGAFSGFLAEATGLPQEALQDGVQQHIAQLKGQLDAYAAGDYEEAYRLFREAYEHMVMTGDTLAGAIVDQNPDMFGVYANRSGAVCESLRPGSDRRPDGHPAVRRGVGAFDALSSPA
jgi:hypothetical protein